MSYKEKAICRVAGITALFAAVFIGGAAIATYHVHPSQRWCLLPYAAGVLTFGGFFTWLASF